MTLALVNFHEDEPIEKWLQALRSKWKCIPFADYASSEELLTLSDRELKGVVEGQLDDREFRGHMAMVYDRYHERLKDKRVLQYGFGLGLEGLGLAYQGAQLTLADLVLTNAILLKRIVRLFRIPAAVQGIEDPFRANFRVQFDVVILSSICRVPFWFAKREISFLLPQLAPHGMVIMLSYPKERFAKSGAVNFSDFARMVEGPNTPWAEWYDLPRVEALFADGYRVTREHSSGKDPAHPELNLFEIVRSSIALPR